MFQKFILIIVTNHSLLIVIFIGAVNAGTGGVTVGGSVATDAFLSRDRKKISRIIHRKI